jgi:hypothetical protein
MKARNTALLLALMLGLAVGAWPAARALAQEPAALPPTQSDPPSRVGRLRDVEGSVSLQSAGMTQWSAAPTNQPLTLGDALWSDAGSRAQLDLGSATVRLDQNSSLALADLSDQSVQLQLSSGSADVIVRSLDRSGVFEIDGPDAAAALLQPGEYRFSVDSSGTTSIAIRNGRAQVALDGAPDMSLATGQRGVFGPNGSYAVMPVTAPDDFDRWCQPREAAWLNAQAASQYVSNDVVGYEDLSGYGDWEAQPDYGPTWFPGQVADDWAPYSDGNWVWVAAWGWTWVDRAAWGFAPFHYGRWVYIARRWGWVPGPRNRHALYAPALVAWVGGPIGGAALSLGGGAAIGWVPLAPGEVYIPGYSVSAHYLEAVNLSNSSHLSANTIDAVYSNPASQNRYANRAAPHALTLIPQTAFVGALSVRRSRVAAPGELALAIPSVRVPAIAPERSSVLGPIALSRVAHPPPGLFNRPLIRRREPPAGPPAFELQRAAINANGALPVSPAQWPHIRATAIGTQGAAPGAALSTSTPSDRRAIPERSARFQPPSRAQSPNVFLRRDQELQQQQQLQRAEPQLSTAPSARAAQSLAQPTEPGASTMPAPRPVLPSPAAPPLPQGQAKRAAEVSHSGPIQHPP